jgi:signal peptidase I
MENLMKVIEMLYFFFGFVCLVLLVGVARQYYSRCVKKDLKESENE